MALLRHWNVSLPKSEEQTSLALQQANVCSTPGPEHGRRRLTH